MYGQTRNFSRHQNVVNEYLKDHSPGTIRTEIPFDLRGYLAYMEERHLSSPEEIPEEDLSRFMLEKDDESKMLA